MVKPSELEFINDVLACAEREQNIHKNIENWNATLKNCGIGLTNKKTEVIRADFQTKYKYRDRKIKTKTR